MYVRVYVCAYVCVCVVLFAGACGLQVSGPCQSVVSAVARRRRPASELTVEQLGVLDQLFCASQLLLLCLSPLIRIPGYLSASPSLGGVEAAVVALLSLPLAFYRSWRRRKGPGEPAKNACDFLSPLLVHKSK